MTTEIQKLSEYEITNRDGSFINAECNTKIINTLVRKINELVDAVNALVESSNIHEKQIDKLQAKVNKLAPTINFAQPKVKDKFVEQRKWVGMLCWFWDDDYYLKTVGVLEEISPIEGEFIYAKKDTRTVWKHCEPVKPDDDIVYKGE